MKKAFNMIIMGAPGGGKGTISKKLINDFKFEHLSTGDVLRTHVSHGTVLGKEAQTYMHNGELVPDQVVISMIIADEKTRSGKNLLLDGFPRTLAQAHELNRVLKIDTVAFLDIPHQTIIDRLSARWVHAESGRTYAYDYNPPKVHGIDDVTGEPLSQRDDDHPETIRKRLEAFDKQTLPLFEYYQSQQLSLAAKRFPGTESDKIYPEIYKYLSAALNK